MVGGFQRPDSNPVAHWLKHTPLEDQAALNWVSWPPPADGDLSGHSPEAISFEKSRSLLQAAWMSVALCTDFWESREEAVAEEEQVDSVVGS